MPKKKAPEEIRQEIEKECAKPIHNPEIALPILEENIKENKIDTDLILQWVKDTSLHTEELCSKGIEAPSSTIDIFWIRLCGILCEIRAYVNAQRALCERQIEDATKLGVDLNPVNNSLAHLLVALDTIAAIRGYLSEDDLIYLQYRRNSEAHPLVDSLRIEFKKNGDLADTLNSYRILDTPKIRKQDVLDAIHRVLKAHRIATTPGREGAIAVDFAKRIHPHLAKLESSLLSHFHPKRGRYQMNNENRNSLPKNVTELIEQYEKGVRDFKSIDLHGALIQDILLNAADFSHADLKGTVFVGSFLEKAKFIDAHVEGAIFTGAHLEGADFSGADLTEANLTNANLAPNADLNSVDPIEFHVQEFGKNGDLKKSTNLERANLTRATLNGAHLEYARLRGARLTEAKLRKANLKYARLPDANLVGAELPGANLEYAELPDANLSSANLEGANLKNAKLTGAKLKYAKLKGAEFPDADLENSDLRYTIGLKLDGNNIRNAKFSSGAPDPWSSLRRTYTGTRLLFHLLFLAVFILPLASRTMIWVGINHAQEAFQTNKNGLNKTVDNINVSVPLAANDVLKLPSIGPCLKKENNCKKLPVLAVVLGWDKGPFVFPVSVFLVLYNIIRIILTYNIGPLREEEERSGYAPAYKDYRVKHCFHIVFHGIFVIAFFSSLYHLVMWLVLPVWVPA